MTRFILLFVLVCGVAFVLTACGVTPTHSPVEIEATKIVARLEACATLESLGTPHPCDPPAPTPTPLPTATPTPLGGSEGRWFVYQDSMNLTPIAPLPKYANPEKICETFWGCPGETYRFVQNGEALAETGTPLGWAVLLIVAGFFVIALPLLIAAVRSFNAPIQQAAQELAKESQMRRALYLEAANQLQLPSPKQGATLPDGREQVVTWADVKELLATFDQQEKYNTTSALLAFAVKQSIETSDTASISWDGFNQLMQEFDAEHHTEIRMLIWRFALQYQHRLEAPAYEEAV